MYESVFQIACIDQLNQIFHEILAIQLVKGVYNYFEPLIDRELKS